jgi:hypothetical protein
MVQRIANADAAPPDNPRSAVRASRRLPASGPASAARRAVSPTLVSALGLEGERMSKVDTAWLRMDSDSNLMMIVGVWVLRPGVSLADLRERVRERLLPYRRFVQLARQDATGAHWIDDPDFNIERHVLSRPLQRKRGQAAQAALQARIAGLALQPLDHAHPLWCFELVEDYEGGSALIARIHHCIADGIALISVMMSLVDGGDLPPKRVRKPARAGMEAAEDWVADTLIRPLGDLTARALEVAGGSAARSLSLMAAPQQHAGPGDGYGPHGRPARQRSGCARPDARRLPHTSQRPAGARQARGLVRSAAAGRCEGNRQGIELLHQRCAAELRGGRHWLVPEGTGR